MDKYDGLKLIKKALSWDAKIDLMRWEKTNDDIEGEAYVSNDIEFTIDDLSVTLDTFLYHKPTGGLEINLRLNDTEYTDSDTFYSSLDRKTLISLISEANIDIKYLEFLISFLNSLDIFDIL